MIFYYIAVLADYVTYANHYILLSKELILLTLYLCIKRMYAI